MIYGKGVMMKTKNNNLKNITYITILFIVILLLLTGYSFGKSLSTVLLSYQAEIAEPIVEVRANPAIDITDTVTEGSYTFYVRNYDENGKISETDIQYTIEIQDTIDEKLKSTMSYELYKNGEMVELQNQKTNVMELSHQSLQEDTYALQIKYNKDASKYQQDMLDKIQIKVHSQQPKNV